MKILFLTPPFISNIEYPLLGVPYLVSFIRKRGFNASQIDMNISYIYELLEKNLFNSVHKNIMLMFKNLNEKQKLNYFEQKDLLTLEKYVSKGAYLTKCAKIKYQKIRKGEKIPDWSEIIKFIVKISYTEALGTSVGLHGKLSKSNIDEIIDIIKSKETSVFHKYIDNILKTEIKKTEPRVIYISLLCNDHLASSLIIARLIKKHLPQTLIFLGGPFITSAYKGIYNSNPLYEIIDGLIIGEGEFPLLNILKKIKNNEQLLNIANLIRKGNNHTFADYFENINEYPEPDYDGLELEKYTKPKAVAFYTSKGCEWGKCVSCSVNKYGNYREKDLTKVLAEIEKLYQKYRIQYISFADNNLSTERMKLIAEFIIENKLEIKWDCRTRFSKDLTEDILQIVNMSNNVYITLAMDSTDENILNIMQKGIKMSTVDFVLDNCEKTSINVNLELKIGLPFETIREANKTFDYPELLRNKYPNLRFLINTKPFKVEQNSIIAEEPKKYGVRILTENKFNNELDLILPEWAKDAFSKQRKICKNNSLNKKTAKRKYKLNYNVLGFQPERKSLTNSISSKFNLAELSNNVLLTEKSIIRYCEGNNIFYEQAAEYIMPNSIISRNGEEYEYITVNKYNFIYPEKRFKVTALVKSVFELCNGNNTIQEIFNKINDKYKTNNISYERLQKNIMTSFNLLYSIGAVNVRLNKKTKNYSEVFNEIY